MADKNLIGLLVWSKWNGKLLAQLFWASPAGEKPAIDSHTKPLVVAQHEIYAENRPRDLVEAIERFPAPALVEEKA